MSQPLLEEILAKLQGLPEDQIALLEGMVKKARGNPIWTLLAAILEGGVFGLV
jgi:hypothetical protein